MKSGTSSKNRIVGARIRALIPVLVVATAAFFLYLGRAHWGVEEGDEGYILELSRRITLGELPYRDFYTLYPPTIYLLLALMFQWGSPSIVAARIFMAVVKTLLIVLGYLAARRMLPKTWALTTPLFLLAVDLVYGLSLISYAALISEALIVPAWLLLETGKARPKPGSSVLAGICCGLAFAFKQHPGALAALAGFLWLSRWCGNRGRPSRQFFLVAPLVILLLGLPLLIQLEWTRLFFLLPAVAAAGVLWLRSGASRLETPPLSSNRPSPWIFAAAFGTTIGVWLLALAPWLGWRLLLKGVFLTPLKDASNRFTPETALFWIGGAEALLAVLLAAFVGAGFFLLSDRELSRTNCFALLGFVLCGFLAQALYPVPSGTRTLWIAVPFVALLSWALKQAFHKLFSTFGAAHPRLLLLALALVVPTLFVPAYPKMQSWTKRSSENLRHALSFYFSTSDSRIDAIKVPALARISEDRAAALTLARTAEWLRLHTKQGESLLIVPNNPLLYFLSERRSPYYYAVDTIPGLSMASPMETLKTNRLDWIVLSRNAGDLQIDPSSRKILADWLTSFRLVKNLGPYHIYRRN